ncbi:sodium-coupled monocarboxylate transporter 1-like isoform X2 [Apostichopus japonicus]|uniref:sodium-coupled monocarboxylate transporter 1-like isoform X2 n=1 Tax=Stichopus japonicus TaxID=307972 RepID=UPI003AB41765
MENDDYITRHFTVWDYIVFIMLLAVSAGIGVYHACTGGKQSTTKEFLLADRNMNALPVAMSLVASFISAITYLGTPVENYLHGSMFWLFGFAYIVVGILTIRLFMPVFFNMNITSAYEYLELRFNKAVRIAGMLTFCLMMVIYLGIVIYAPALALSAVTDLSLWGSVFSVGLVCTFYTTIGGMKAVLWTDVFQVTLMFIGFFAMIIGAAVKVGGFRRGWQIAKEGGRIDFFDFRPDPTIRHTFWSVVVGGTFTWLAVYGVNQSQVQRYLACGTRENARKALIMATIGMLLVVCAACMTGIMMYAYYADCDPISAGLVEKADQLVPFLVMDLFGKIPGLPGLLVSSCFSAALSTVSSGLNSLAAVTGEDIVKSIYPNMEERKYTFITKVLAASYGLLAVFMAFVASQLGDVLQTALSFFGMVGGPLLGLFSLGIFFPCANAVGAIVGLLSGLIAAFWINIGSQFYPPPLEDPPLYTYNCAARFPGAISNISDYSVGFTEYPMRTGFTEIPGTIGAPDDRPAIATMYALSYSWYSLAFGSTTLIVGLLVSLCTGRTRSSTVDPKLMCPIFDVMACCLPERFRSKLRCGIRYEEEKEGEPELTNVNYIGVSDQADKTTEEPV